MPRVVGRDHCLGTAVYTAEVTSVISCWCGQRPHSGSTSMRNVMQSLRLPPSRMWMCIQADPMCSGCDFCNCGNQWEICPVLPGNNTYLISYFTEREFKGLLFMCLNKKIRSIQVYSHYAIRLEPTLASVVGHWQTAALGEREVADFTGRETEDDSSLDLHI